MAKVQIGEREYDEEDLRASVKLRETVANWMKNPKARRKILEAEKAFNPAAKIDELDQPDPIDERVAPLLKTVEELQKQVKEDREARESQTNLQQLTTSIDAGIAALKRDHRWLDGTEAEVRKIMTDEGIVKPEIAWAVFQARHPPSNVLAPNGGSAWGFMDAPAEGTDAGDDIKALIASKGESESVIRKMTNQALKEVRAA